jgi:CheY-like chemotaxis protein
LELESLEEIIIIEDDLIISRMHQYALKQLVQQDVQVFENGEKAKDYLTETENTGRILVLLDLHMPVMNGWEFLDTMKDTEHYNRLFIVVVTSSPFKEDLKKAGDYNRVFAIYLKPLNKNNIIEILQLIQKIDTCS